MKGEKKIDSSNALTSILRGISDFGQHSNSKGKSNYLSENRYFHSGDSTACFIGAGVYQTGTKIHFQITLNDDYLKDAEINFDYLEEAIRAFYELQNNWFVRAI